ncbi:hypothetical protein [Burkholderia glumae]|nr:hypothetical protein [Burkholderia glumae]
MQLIVDEAESGVDRPFMAKRGWPPPGDARPAQIDPKRSVMQ